MFNTIEKLQTPAGSELVNVPADPETLVALGFSVDRATQICEEIDRAVRLDRLFDSRRAAYIVESDPLYMEWQFDQTPESEKAWRDKVAEIKARYPLPAE